MLFITKWPWLLGDKHKPWAIVFIDPLAHALIDAVDPTQYKIVGHILVPTIQRIMYFPKPVTELWWFLICVCWIVEYIFKP